MVNKNLFLYDLAIVAIIKNEAPYLREWLDYHLLAGVEHFYLYDNDSTDNQAEVVAPYVEAGLVDYFPLSGKHMQYIAYNDAVKRFRYQCRYMAFIDADEFLCPKSNRSVAEVVAEILSQISHAEALVVNWQIFGSNGQQTADYSRGVLERFTRRAPTDWSLEGFGNTHVKTIANPRAIDYINNPHYAVYFLGCFAANECGVRVENFLNEPVTAEKIVVNHYYTKSREEFAAKIARGRADIGIEYKNEWFDMYDRNEIFDDEILRYRAARDENFSPESNVARFNRVTEALTETLADYAAGKIFSLETALNCRAVSTYLRENFPADEKYWRTCEVASLDAILKSLRKIPEVEAWILIRDLPNILRLPYPAVKHIRDIAQQIISHFIKELSLYDIPRNFVGLNYVLELLKSGGTSDA